MTMRQMDNSPAFISLFSAPYYLHKLCFSMRVPAATLNLILCPLEAVRRSHEMTKLRMTRKGLIPGQASPAELKEDLKCLGWIVGCVGTSTL